MNEKDKKLLEFAKNAKDRKKKANEKQYDSFDRVSVVLPKGTKERITATGKSINGLINELVLAYLENEKIK